MEQIRMQPSMGSKGSKGILSRNDPLSGLREFEPDLISGDQSRRHGWC